MPSDSMFSVSVSRNQLVVAEISRNTCRTLCMLDLRMNPSFYIDNGDVVCRDGHGREFVLKSTDSDAESLLNQLVIARKAGARSRSSKSCWTLRLVSAVGLIAIGYFAALSQKYISALSAVDNTPAAVIAPASTSRPVAADPVVREGTVWSLPTSVPEKLRNAADRKLFTVEYSNGHQRSLYVFADPACPNCQRLEPLLKAASTEFNVVVFPVAVIGKDKSIASVTSVLCLPPEQRKAAWTALFDIGRDGLSLGKAEGVGSTASGLDACVDAQRALGINEVAYRAYRIPGTPWVIADDGRHVKQSLLADPAGLKAFLDGREVSDATE